MNRLRTIARAVCVTLLMAVPATLNLWAAGSKSCSTMGVPGQIREALEKDYPGWKIVTPELLESSDRDVWTKQNKGACPGMIKGNFSGEGTSYAFNLIKQQKDKTVEQVIYFRPQQESFEKVIVVRPFTVPYLGVLNRFGPGKYDSSPGNESIDQHVVVRTDVIAFSGIGAGTIVYYWRNGRFHEIITSD